MRTLRVAAWVGWRRDSSWPKKLAQSVVGDRGETTWPNSTCGKPEMRLISVSRKGVSSFLITAFCVSSSRSRSVRSIRQLGAQPMPWVRYETQVFVAGESTECRHEVHAQTPPFASVSLPNSPNERP